MSTTVTYKGNTLTTVSNATKTLKTAGKYMEDDVQLTDTTSTIVISETTDSHGGIIKTITTTDEVNLQVKTINPTTSTQTVNPDTGYDGFSQVIVGAGSGSINNQNKTVTPTKSQQQITADSGYSGLGTVTVNAIPSQYIVPSGNKEITANGTGIDVTQYATVSVNVPTGGGGDTINNQNKTVTPTESQQTITADSGYTGLGTVTVNAISSTYVGSDIVARDGDDLTASGATVSVPAGYYSAAASKSVASGTVTAPPTISGTAASVSTGSGTLTLTKTVSVTPRVTTAGYISSGTAGNSSVSLTANVTIDPIPTASGATVTIPAGYYTEQTTKSVSSGSAKGPTSLSGSSATVTTGTNTLTLTKTGVTTTPTVSAGYVSSATASTATVALTASVTTKTAATYYATTSDQTISASQYLTGAQTIKALSQTNLSAANIKAGTTISVNNGSTNVWSVAGTYTSDATAAAADIVDGETAYVNGSKVTGTLIVQDVYVRSTAPTASVGNDGDIYIQE